MDNKLKIGFTLGDVNGIGPEVLIKALDDNRILKLCTPVIYGSNRILSFYKKMFNIEGFNYTTCVDADQSNTKSVNIINCITDDIILQPGQDTAIGGKTALISLEAATQDLLAKKIDALVTAPINKNNMQQSGFNYHGHTEYFNAKAGDKESVMLLMNENLRVGLVTNHLAIKEIPAAITKEKILQKIELINHSLKQDFAIFNPTIQVMEDCLVMKKKISSYLLSKLLRTEKYMWLVLSLLMDFLAVEITRNLTQYSQCITIRDW